MTEPPSQRLNPGLLGHAAAERTLGEAFASGRLAHAWMLCGPRGIGKATLAYRFARFVLAGGDGGAGRNDGLFGDRAATDLAMAGDHPVAQRIAAGAHLDLLAIERRINERTGRLRDEIVVDDVRRIGDFLSKTSAEGGWRVVIVDAADELNRNAANALLKWLEEPPRRALLLLVAHNPGRVLPTMRSRCRRLTLRSLDTATVAEIVGRILPGLSDDDRRHLARISGGSVARALALGDARGLDVGRRLLSLLEGLPDLDLVALHGLADDLARGESSDRFRAAADIVRWWLADRIRDRATGSRSGPLDPWLQVWEKTDQLLSRAAGLDLDRKQVVLAMVLGLQGAARN